MPTPIVRLHLAAGLTACCLLSSASWAGNGMNTIGVGAESIAMGGADVAVVRDTNAIAINPAALTRIEQQALDLYVSPFYSLGRHQDAVGNDQRVDDPINTTAGGGYARRLQDAPDLVLGLGAFVQGGTGYNYKQLRTGFGTRDDLSALFGVFKFALGAGWQASDTLSLGATVGVSHAQARQKYFPQTSNVSDPNRPLLGLRLDGLESTSFSASLGALYQVTPKLSLGWAYTSETPLELDGGTLTLNYEALGLSRVRYNDAQLDGLSVPQELSFGFAYQASPQWLFAGDLRWLDWSVIDSSRLVARHPDHAQAPQTIDAVTAANWRDQLVLALGFAFRPDTKTTLRAGVNVGRDPVPKQTLTPTFNLLEAYEFDLGYGRRLGKGWELAGALQIIPAQSQRYDDPNGILGRSRETFEAYIITVGLSRRW